MRKRKFFLKVDSTRLHFIYYATKLYHKFNHGSFSSSAFFLRLPKRNKNYLKYSSIKVNVIFIRKMDGIQLTLCVCMYNRKKVYAKNKRVVGPWESWCKQKTKNSSTRKEKKYSKWWQVSKQKIGFTLEKNKYFGINMKKYEFGNWHRQKRLRRDENKS